VLRVFERALRWGPVCTTPISGKSAFIEKLKERPQVGLWQVKNEGGAPPA
jgi:hypothetical protein